MNISAVFSKNIRFVSFSIVSALLLVPLSASAHAIPVSMTPASSGTVKEAPSEISITFSERVDANASAVSITSPSMVMKAQIHVDPKQPHTLVAPLMNDGNGTYLVSWSVVSADDGHFTRGSYAFAVGKGVAIATSTKEAEVVTISTKPEALAMTVELFGNGIMWASLVLFAWVYRPLRKSGRYKNEEAGLERGYAWFISLGALLAIIGGALQIWIKSADLSGIQFTPLSEAAQSFVHTGAGSSIIVRIVCAFTILTLFHVARTFIVKAERFTFYEILLFLALCVFAYFRAKISHATANPFHPELSIAVNFLHVIEKDIWAGITLALAFAAANRKLRGILQQGLPRISELLAIDFGLVSVTASYIVWLHLKGFSNLFASEWGAAFLQLLCIAVCLVCIRFYHALARRYRPAQFSVLLPYSFGVEFALALLVVYYSSVVIITSPPLSPSPVLEKHDQGATLTLSRDDAESSMLLLTVGNASAAPTVTLTKEGSPDPLSIDLAKRFDGGYVFPASLLVGQAPYVIDVTAPQKHGYDAHAEFILPDHFAETRQYEGARSFDAFTITMILIALAAIAASVFLYRLSRAHAVAESPRGGFLGFKVLGSFLAATFIGAASMHALSTSTFANPYKALCESDGNMWHLMQPMKAGVPLSETAREGCMWGMGKYIYHFTDRREYEYLSTLPHATVSIDKQTFAARVPSRFTISLEEADGSPAKLSWDMDKLLHVVIVSRDESVFAHIHPDDVRPLTQKEIDTSTFTLDYAFPKSGDYLIVADYAHGLTLEQQKFLVHVSGAPAQKETMVTYPQSGTFQGYQVTLDSGQPYAGEVTTVRFTITKDGKPVTNIVPWLEAAMHVSIVKQDFSEFIHVHGEVHPPGTALAPIWVKNGQVVHSMAMMTLPAQIGPNIEAHFIFPTSGIYTIWAQFKVGESVIPSSFTVKVE